MTDRQTGVCLPTFSAACQRHPVFSWTTAIHYSDRRAPHRIDGLGERRQTTWIAVSYVRSDDNAVLLLFWFHSCCSLRSSANKPTGRCAIV